ncbi:uncharacterized protein LOC114716600 [Neltuma alba]|uniref:uncharacterized protein LOC114716600 n=1 Tax=Neltuma alba TaxID=207710 RepID=UPI0010A560CE|nr:uncharacterized protein LOC114716600 [Prosopis alba]
MCSSGEEEYDSRAEYDTVGPASLNGTNTPFGSFFSPISHSNQQNPNFFDPSPNNYLHAASQSLPAASIPNSEPSCTLPPEPPLSSSSSSFLFAGNPLVGGCRRETAHEHNNAVRNSKKRSRASRRAPTTFITTDTSNFRFMVREFTGVPAPPSSAASHSCRFHPFRPSPRYLDPPNPFLSPLSSSANINATVNIAPAENVVHPTAPAAATHNAPTSHQLLSDLGFAFQTPHHLPLPTSFSSKSQPYGSGYEPCSVETPFSEWPVNATNSWPSHF